METIWFVIGVMVAAGLVLGWSLCHMVSPCDEHEQFLDDEAQVRELKEWHEKHRSEK